MNKETLEEAAERIRGLDLPRYFYQGFVAGGKWQAERMYSDEEVLDILFKHTEYFAGFGERVSLTEWFKQFKKK